MTAKTTIDLKVIALAAGLVANCVALGWFAATQTSRIAVLERDAGEAKLERQGLNSRLQQLDRLVYDTARIKQDVSEIKEELKS